MTDENTVLWTVVMVIAVLVIWLVFREPKEPPK